MITAKEFRNFIKDYHKDNNNQRLGQYFLNTFASELVDPTLFYCEDEDKCIEIIFKKYIKDYRMP